MLKRPGHDHAHLRLRDDLAQQRNEVRRASIEQYRRMTMSKRRIHTFQRVRSAFFGFAEVLHKRPRPLRFGKPPRWLSGLAVPLLAERGSLFTGAIREWRENRGVAYNRNRRFPGSLRSLTSRKEGSHAANQRATSVLRRISR